jgi:hypothetical protein
LKTFTLGREKQVLVLRHWTTTQSYHRDELLAETAACGGDDDNDGIAKAVIPVAAKVADQVAAG